MIDLSDRLSALAHDVLLLLAMVNAVGNLPIFAELSEGMTRVSRRRAFNTAVLTGGGIVVGFAFLGDWMLQSIFQVSTDAFKVAGGILVFFVAARGMILGPRKMMVDEGETAGNIGVFPMGFPLLAGPGTIVTTILLMQYRGRVATAVAAAVVYAAVYPMLHLAPLIKRVVGRVGVLVVSRILYIFICAKAVAFALSGIAASMR